MQANTPYIQMTGTDYRPAELIQYVRYIQYIAIVHTIYVLYHSGLDKGV